MSRAIIGPEPLTDAPAGLPIEGYASLWGVADLNGDVVAQGAFSASLAAVGARGVRMLHQHESRSIVGVWDELIEDERGLRVRGRIMDWSAEARFAQALSRAGALDGLSIGFRSQRARREGRLRVLVEVALWEVSLVTFPMLPGARFTAAAARMGSPSGRSDEATDQHRWPRRGAAIFQPGD